MRLGELAVYLTANTGDFTNKMRGAENQLTRLASKFAAFGAAGLSVGGAFEFARRMTKDYLASVWELDRVGRMTGMSADQFDYFADAATAAEVGVEAVITSVRMMQRELGKSVVSMEFREALAEIGLTAERLKAQKPAQQFNLIAGSLAEVVDPTERASLAMRLFGKRGTEILPMLADGKEGLEEFTKAADKWGFGMSKAGMETARQVNKDIKEMGFQWAALKTKLTEGVFIPILGGGWALATMDRKSKEMGVKEASGFGKAGVIGDFMLSYLGGFVGAGDTDQLKRGAVRGTEGTSREEVAAARMKRHAANIAKEEQDKAVAETKAQLEIEKNAAKTKAQQNKLVKEGMDAAANDAKLREKYQNDLLKSETALAAAREEAYLDSVDAEGKLAYLAEKRARIFDSINTQDELDTNRKQEQLVELTGQMDALKKEGLATPEQFRLAGAMQKGSVEAYSAINKSGHTQDQLLESAKKSVGVQEKILDAVLKQRPVEEVTI